MSCWATCHQQAQRQAGVTLFPRYSDRGKEGGWTLRAPAPRRSGLPRVKPPPACPSPSPGAPTAPSALQGLCPELPAKQHFNNTDKSPSRNHHPQHLGEMRHEEPVTTPESKGHRRMCRNCSLRLPCSQGALCQQGQVPQSPPDKGGLFSPGQGGWVAALATLAHSCCQHDPETDE